MNWKTTLALVVVAAAMGGAVYFQQQKGGAAGTPTPFTLPNALWTDVRTGQVNRLEVRQGEQVGSAEKADDGQWSLVLPSPGPADTTRVDSLVSSLVNVRATRTLTDAAAVASNLPQYGLDRPSVVVEATGKDVSPVRLSVGIESPAGGNRYALREGSPNVYLISSSVVSDLLKLITDPPKATPTPTPAPTGTPTPGS